MANEKTVVADIDGTLVSWSDGYFSSPNRVLLNQVKKNAEKGDLYRDLKEDEYVTPELLAMAKEHYTTILTRGGEEVLAGGKTPLTAAAAMSLVDPGRTTFPVSNNADDLDEYFDNVYYSESESYLKSVGEYDDEDTMLVPIDDDESENENESD